jgi:hypothetical protein
MSRLLWNFGGGHWLLGASAVFMMWGDTEE